MGRLRGFLSLVVVGLLLEPHAHRRDGVDEARRRQQQDEARLGADAGRRQQAAARRGGVERERDEGALGKPRRDEAARRQCREEDGDEDARQARVDYVCSDPEVREVRAEAAQKALERHALARHASDDSGAPAAGEEARWARWQFCGRRNPRRVLTRCAVLGSDEHRRYLGRQRSPWARLSIPRGTAGAGTDSAHGEARQRLRPGAVVRAVIIVNPPSDGAGTHFPTVPLQTAR